MKQADILLITFGLGCITMLAIGAYLITRSADRVKNNTSGKTVAIKPQQKDTTTYHFSDEFTDAQLREMVRSGHLKLR